jgi:hypothetical protein
MATVQRDVFRQGTGAMDEAKNMANDAANKAKEAGATLTQKVGDAASFVGKKAEDAASFVGKKAEDATSGLGSGMKSLADTIREKGPDGGPLGAAGSAVASTLESGGKYLQEHGLGGIGEDMAGLIKRNPIPALLVGIGLGFLIARATTRS